MNWNIQRLQSLDEIGPARIVLPVILKGRQHGAERTCSHGIVQRHDPFVFGICHILPALRRLFAFQFLGVVSERLNLQADHRSDSVVDEQGITLHGLVGLRCTGGMKNQRRFSENDIDARLIPLVFGQGPGRDFRSRRLPIGSVDAGKAFPKSV